MIDQQTVHREKTVLGWILARDTDGWEWSSRVLDADCFELPQHAALFAACVAAAKLHGRPNRHNVLALLSTKGRVEDVGGKEYVVGLADSFASSSVAESYAKRMLGEKRKRSFLVALARELGRGNEPEANEDPVAFVEGALQRITAASLAATDDGLLVPIADAIEEAAHELAESNRANGSRGVPSGIESVDHLASRMRGGELIVLAARTSVGKTAFATSMALETARSGQPVAVFSLEMTRADMAFRAIAASHRFDLQRLRSGQLSEREREEVAVAAAEVARLPIHVFGGNRKVSPELDLAKLRTLCRRFRAQYADARDGLVVVDYLQLVKTATGDERKRHELVAEITRGMKHLALELDWPVVALSQLSREADKRDKPKLSDLRESGSIEQDADRVLLLHRPGKDANTTDSSPTSSREYRPNRVASPPVASGSVEVIVAKNRNGRLGVVPVTFVEHAALFADLGAEGG